jgi:integrase/recombinase XerD
MASSIKVLLWSKANKEGLYPIVIRIIKDRKPSYIYLGHYIKKEQWDAEERKVRKSHPNSGKLNGKIIAKLAEFSGKILDLEAGRKDTSVRAIKKTIQNTSQANFKSQAQVYIDNLKRSGKYNRLSAEEPRVNRFMEFAGDDIAFREITIPLLNKYKSYLKGTRNISERTIVNHLVVIRSIFNQAIKGNLVESKYYPFGNNRVQIKFPESIKIGLVPDEVKALEEVDLSEGKQHHARNIWLFSFYFAGMRVSDVLRLTWSELHDGRLYYSMGKNGKVGSLKIPEKAQKILNEYIAGKDETDLVFPELKGLQDIKDNFHVQMRIKTKVSALNEALREVKKEAKIDKKLTMHIPRHSFGNISGDKIPVQMLQKLYRHTSITTTIGYQANFINKDADDALDKVLGI